MTEWHFASRGKRRKVLPPKLIKTMQIQELTDYGTADPIVTRLSIQTQDLLHFYSLTDTQKQRIFGVMFSDIQPKLVTCSRIKDQLKKEVKEHQKIVEQR